MAEDRKKLRTSTMLRRLFKTKSLSAFIRQNESGMVTEDFGEYVKTFCREKNITVEGLIKNTGIERTYGHQLVNGTRKPSRDKVLQFALAMELEPEKAQHLLRIADKSELYPRIKRDAVIIYALNNHLSFQKTQELLYENSLTLLGGSSQYEELS